MELRSTSRAAEAVSAVWVAALVHLGRDAEARDAAARLLQLDPAFSDRSGRSIKLEAAT
jgi:hypothetical protein